MAEKCFCSVKDRVTCEIYVVKDKEARTTLNAHSANLSALDERIQGQDIRLNAIEAGIQVGYESTDEILII